MFDRAYLRRYIAVIWIIALLLLLGVFQYILLPKDSIINKLTTLEQSIQREEWASALMEMKDFRGYWEKARLRIQINNSSEDFAVLEQTLGELESQIKYREDDALESIGGLKEIFNKLTKAFPGP